MQTQIKWQQGKVALISGGLDFNTVPTLDDRGCYLIQEHAEVLFDFERVTKSDRSALVLLLSWIRCARRFNKKIGFVHLPQQLCDLARVSGISELLPTLS